MQGFALATGFGWQALAHKHFASFFLQTDGFDFAAAGDALINFADGGGGGGGAGIPQSQGLALATGLG